MMCNECKIDLCTLTKADLKLKSRLKRCAELVFKLPVRASLMQQYALMNQV